MRFSRAVVCLGLSALAGFAFTGAGYASTIDKFTITVTQDPRFNHSGLAEQIFYLPPSPTPSSYLYLPNADLGQINFLDVSVINLLTDGTSFVDSEEITFVSQNVAVATGRAGVDSIYPAFTGYDGHPTFLLGTYMDDFVSDQELVIESVPTPEPSTLAMLGTGALGLVGVVRRRLLA